MGTEHAIVREIESITLAAKADSNHWVILDGLETFGGSDAGPRPRELLLMALGSCTASDVISILKKKRVAFDGLELRLTGTVKKEHPQVFTNIHMWYVLYGDRIDPKDVDRPIQLSTTKYSSVLAMLRAIVNIKHHYKIEPSLQQSDSEKPSSITA